MKKLYCFFLFLLVQNYLFAEPECLKRIHAHLTIHDAESACVEAKMALEQFPDNHELSESYIKALSLAKNEHQLILFAQDYLSRFPEKLKQREMLEHLSWGVIENGSLSSAPLIRIYALLAAFFANDAKGIALIKKSLDDNNSLLRAAAIQLSSELRDIKLQDKILKVMSHDPVFIIRLEAIKAVGLMKNNDAKEQLQQIIANDSAEHEEKALAIESLVNIMDSVRREEIENLSNSSRFGFRLLACELVLAQELEKDIDLIMPLLYDPQREVRKAALEVIGTLRIKSFQGRKVSDIVQGLLNDLEPQVRVTAAFVLILNDKLSGQEAFKPFLKSEVKEIRLLAASALAKSGQYGFPLIIQAFNEATDPFVKMNLSFGLIGQREMIEPACNALYLGLIEEHEPFMWVENGIFKYLALSKHSTKESIPNQKQAMNQLVRLEILNILSIMKYKHAEDGIRQFLKKTTWGISAMASLLILSEGDESSIELVQNLLKDPDEKIRVQAALILSLWNSGDDAIYILQDSYKTADREMKERILEGVGRIGSLSSISFLVECLGEPFQSLRVIAASSLLQILYH